VTDPAATLRALNQIAAGHLKTLGQIQLEVTGEPDRLTGAGTLYGQQASRVTGVARLMAEQRESLTQQWWGFAGQNFQGDAKGLVEKLAMVENGLRRERNRMNSAGRLLRTARSTVDGEILDFDAKANAITARVNNNIEPNYLLSEMNKAGNDAVQRSLTAQAKASNGLGVLFETGADPLGLPYDAWRAKKEYDSLVNYIHKEMVDNSHSPEAARMRWMNDGSIADSLRASMVWYDMVASDQPWDHKWKLNDLYELKRRGTSEYQGSSDFYSPMPAAPASISYQVWSNIHYGYVGKEVGFTETWLQFGAGTADYLARGKLDPGDAVAIDIGFELRRNYAPDELRPEHINAAIIRRYDDLVMYGKIRPTTEWDR
jgi:hypothetical protein